MLPAGHKLGPYEIVAPIGKGGMGEVYRARDPRLGRDVAIKLSDQQFSERFEREARAVAALNHPHVCHLYDVGPNFLVMELVEGETLAERIRQGPIPLDSALKLARQIADALQAAHEKGIVHRDLKPANVKITPEGSVKVLDFGLAKVNARTTSAGDPENSPTLTMAATQAGVILGTAAYMSPEQARGKPVDKRADIWAFGVVLYEMLTGRRLFQGEDLTDTLASVVKEQPDLNAAPFEVRRLLTRCLEKDPNKRLGDLSVIWELLDDAATPAKGAAASRLGWWAAAVLFVSTGAFAFLWLRAPAPDSLNVQFEINSPPGFGFSNLNDSTAISPDGRYVVFSAGDQTTGGLWLRPLDSVTARRLPGTEGASEPFWSPDSKSIAFYQDNKVKRMDIAGGSSVVLCESGDMGGAGGSWSGDGTILFGSGRNIFRVSASGGVAQQVTKLDESIKEVGVGFPQFLPDGKHFLALRYTEDRAKRGIIAASLDNPNQPVWLVPSDRNASYVPPRNGQPGYLLWMRDQTLLAQPFEASALKLEGDATPIAENLLAPPGNIRARVWASNSGVLAYRKSVGGTGSTLTWLDREGKVLSTVGKAELYSELALSPDGTQIAAFRRDEVGEDIWLIDVARASSSRLTTDPANESFPVWSPDGKQVAFNRFQTGEDGGIDLYRKPAGVAGQDELLLKDGARNSPLDWSHDGRYLLYSRIQGKVPELWLLPLREPERKPVKYLATQFAERSGTFSPDGRWVMYSSNVSGREEVYVSPFPDAASAPAVLVSTEGGDHPHWRRDGKAVYYLSPDLKLVEVEILAGSGFKVGVPKTLFQTHTRPLGDPAGWLWDISPDGKRFLFNVLPDQQTIAPLTVITNWQATLKK